MTSTRIPVLKVGPSLLATLPGDVDDTMVEQLQLDLLERLGEPRVRGVLLDLSAVEVVDSFLARSLSEIGRMVRLLNGRTVVVGIQPAVAVTLVELGLKLPGVETALNVDHGLQRLALPDQPKRTETARGGVR